MTDFGFLCFVCQTISKNAILSSHVLQTTKKQKDIFANKQITIDSDGMTDGRQIIIIFFPVILRQIG